MMDAAVERWMKTQDEIEAALSSPRRQARADSATNPGDFFMSNDAQARADIEACSEAAMKYEHAARALGDKLPLGVPPRVAGESSQAYRARLASKFQKYSDKFKDSDLFKVKDAAVLAGVEDAIYADAVTASNNGGMDVAPNTLIPRIRKDDMGIARFKDYIGRPDACWNQFKLRTQFVKRWGDEKTGKNAFTLS